MPAIVQIGRTHALHARQSDRIFEHPRTFHPDSDDAETNGLAVTGLRRLRSRLPGRARERCDGQAASGEKGSTGNTRIHNIIMSRVASLRLED